MSEILKPGLVLLTVTAVAALALGLAYTVTKEPIERQKTAEEEQSRVELLPYAETFKEVAADGGSEITSVTEGHAGSDVVGYVIGVSVMGYGGRLDMLVGVDAGNAVTGVKIMSHSETPGLGANAANESFTDKYKNKTGPFTVTKTTPTNDNEIDAITSATITTTAVTLGVNAAVGFVGALATP
jgi:electron transport complex protein RnfG